MDKHFLEFWGNFLIHAAKGQKQLEDLSAWMHQGFTGFDELTALFRKFYGLEYADKTAPDYSSIQEKAVKDFQKSFKDFLLIMGVVPKDDHLDLLKKYEALKETLAAREETIDHLRMLLAEKDAKAQGELAKGFQELMEKQGKQFHQAMETFGRLYSKKNNQS